jgi:hypothetical protein
MSTQENPLESAELVPEQAITIQPSAITPYTGGAEWPTTGEHDPAHAGNLGLDALLHSLRRYWLVMFCTGVAAAALAVVGVWLAIKPKYEAEAVLTLAPAQPVILHNPGGEDSDRVADEFNIFRGTQALLLKQRFVFMAALRNPKMKNLQSILREDARHKTIPWLTSVVQVNLEKNSGIMRVTAALPDPSEAAIIVNAVVAAYMDEVVNRDQGKRRDRLDSLTAVSAQKEEEVRKLREDLKREMESLGVGDEQAASQRGQMAVQIYAEYQRELQKMRFDRTTLQGKKLEDETLLKTLTGNSPEDYKVSESEIAIVLINNPVYHELLPRQQMLQQAVTAAMKLRVPGSREAPSFSQARAQLEATDASIQQLKAKAEMQVREAKRIELERELRRLDTEIGIATDQVESFAKEVAGKQRDAEAVGRSTVAAQMLKAKLENLERILHGVADERERLKVELDNPRLRVTIQGDKDSPAAVPEEETGAIYRYFLIGLSGLVGLCLPAAGLVVWDLRKRRVNSPADVAK